MIELWCSTIDQIPYLVLLRHNFDYIVHFRLLLKYTRFFHSIIQIWSGTKLGKLDPQINGTTLIIISDIVSCCCECLLAFVLKCSSSSMVLTYLTFILWFAFSTFFVQMGCLFKLPNMVWRLFYKLLWWYSHDYI